MSKKYKVIYLPIFNKDLKMIIKYVERHLKNPIAARNLLDKIQQEIENRIKEPEAFEKCKINGNIYYRIYINNYIVYYRVIKDTIEFRRVLYAKKNITKKF